MISDWTGLDWTGLDFLHYVGMTPVDMRYVQM